MRRFDGEDLTGELSFQKHSLCIRAELGSSA
jgi:hypothetical protein